MTLPSFRLSFASFSAWNNYKNNLFFTIWVMFWNISRISFFLFSIQNFKSNCYIFFFKFFQSSFSDGKFIPFQLYFFIKRLIFVILWGSFFIFSWFHVTVPACWKHLLSFLLIGFIAAFLFCIQSGESIYDPPWFGFIYHIYKPITEQSYYLITFLWFQIILISIF